MAEFRALFGHDVEVMAYAPGRVNLMGDHTDYNRGLVLPAAIPQRTEVAVAAGEGRRVRVWSDQFSDTAPVVYQLGAETRDGGWADYVRGMTQVLASHGLQRGFDARIASTIPLGSGLSSSASLEVALGRALRELFTLSIDDIALALAGQRAENEFVGAPVGVMDQMACSLADESSALFLDTSTLGYERVSLPSAAALAVIHSGLSHSHATGGYAARRRECSQAADALGVASLRELTSADVERITRLPAPLDRRVQHVMSENARVVETVAALKAGNVAAAGRLFAASHRSLREDYEVSVPEIDRLVETATRVAGSYGARLTGGGFGGAIVMLCAPERVHDAAHEVVDAARRQGGAARVVVPPEPK